MDDGRPAALPRPPDGAERFHPTRNPVQQGDEVWINDKGRWYPGTVVELTDNIAFYMVQYDGWEDRPPAKVNIAWLRRRTLAPE